MITSAAILRGDRKRLLAFDADEHPVALQLGGSEPKDLAIAAKAGEDFGYDEINLNCGCPSDRVSSGSFGACLMREPERVADCVAAMKAAVRIPVTVKMRIGVVEGQQARTSSSDRERVSDEDIAELHRLRHARSRCRLRRRDRSRAQGGARRTLAERESRGAAASLRHRARAEAGLRSIARHRERWFPRCRRLAGRAHLV